MDGPGASQARVRVLRGDRKSRRANVLPLSRVRPFARGCATQRVAPSEPRKRRASERPHVGSCEELGGRLGLFTPTYASLEPDVRHKLPAPISLPKEQTAI